MNFRGRSGEVNRKPYSYHSGKTDDLALIIQRLEQTYTVISLIGFSLGGNVLLNYLGEMGDDVSPSLKASAAISVPCDLRSGSIALSEPRN
tara:strand:- start:417 stop:689 length:273 start_codon:yes stop_codon:yes gene_type:complete